MQAATASQTQPVFVSKVEYELAAHWTSAQKAALARTQCIWKAGDVTFYPTERERAVLAEIFNIDENGKATAKPGNPL